MVDTVPIARGESQSQLRRDIDWKDAFWVASGVPPLVLFSIGGIAAAAGTPSVLVWTLSVLFGFTAISSNRMVLSSVVRTPLPFRQYTLESYLQAQSSQTP